MRRPKTERVQPILPHYTHQVLNSCRSERDLGLRKKDGCGRAPRLVLVRSNHFQLSFATCMQRSIIGLTSFRTLFFSERDKQLFSNTRKVLPQTFSISQACGREDAAASSTFSSSSYDSGAFSLHQVSGVVKYACRHRILVSGAWHWTSWVTNPQPVRSGMPRPRRIIRPRLWYLPATDREVHS